MPERDERKPGIDDLLGQINKGPQDDAPSDDSVDEESQEPEVETAAPSLVKKLISDEPFRFKEVQLAGGKEKEQGVTLQRGMNDSVSLTFDSETIDMNEQGLIDSFVALIESQGKAGLKGTRFEWFFAEESEEFLQGLADSLKQRKDEINDSLRDQSLLSQQLGDRMSSAFDSFREMAKREQLKKAIDQQVQRIPIEYFEAQTLDGQITRLKFDPNNLNDPRNEVEFIFVNAPDGTTELVFSCKHPDKYKTIRPKFYGNDQKEIQQQGEYFGVDPLSVENINEQDADGGLDTSRYEFEVDPGFAGTVPLFKRVKVLKKPVNLDDELDKYVEEKRKEAEEKLEREKQERDELIRRQQAQASSSQSSYAPLPPSAPTPTPRWQSQPTNYSRSG